MYKVIRNSDNHPDRRRKNDGVQRYTVRMDMMGRGETSSGRNMNLSTIFLLEGRMTGSSIGWT
jgi:hypothetical protein